MRADTLTNIPHESMTRAQGIILRRRYIAHIALRSHANCTRGGDSCLGGCPNSIDDTLSRAFGTPRSYSFTNTVEKGSISGSSIMHLTGGKFAFQTTVSIAHAASFTILSSGSKPRNVPSHPATFHGTYQAFRLRINSCTGSCHCSIVI